MHPKPLSLSLSLPLALSLSLSVCWFLCLLVCWFWLVGWVCVLLVCIGVGALVCVLLCVGVGLCMLVRVGVCWCGVGVCVCVLVRVCWCGVGVVVGVVGVESGVTMGSQGRLEPTAQMMAFMSSLQKSSRFYLIF